jgi:DNA-directed RNA polymerase subunit RPC12/RpoP
MINVVAVDNRFSLTQVISFFSTLGIHSYAGGLTPLTYQSQIYSINPYKGGCPACQFTASDFAIINTHAHCSGDSSPEEGVISIFCVAQSCAGKLISFINRDFHTNFDKKSGHKGSYKTIDSPETCLRLDINRNPECASHFPPFDDVLNASGLWTLQDLFNHVSDRMGEPVKTVELGFEWQARDADNEFINKYYCMNCHKNFFLPRLRKRVCPYCKNTRHKIITIPFSNKPTLSMNDLQPYILESVTLDCLDIRANDVFRASGLKKSIFVRNGGNI